jgi:hypothetical protein
MMGVRIAVSRAERDHILNDLPVEIASQCRRISSEIRAEQNDVRDKKIMAARIRMCSGYYDSEAVIRAISSRLLTEITSEDISS